MALNVIVYVAYLEEITNHNFFISLQDYLASNVLGKWKFFSTCKLTSRYVIRR